MLIGALFWRGSWAGGADLLWQGKEGVVIVKAVSCVFVARHPSDTVTQDAAPIVEKLADYINNPQ